MTSKTIENPLFSIVIPVYNTEDYVAEAIESIVRQSSNMFSRTEVLLVDDGSTDQSARICQGFVDRYPANIKLLRKENSGTSASKNLGIEHARGEFVGFLDSDDKYEGSMFSSLMSFRERFPEVQVISVPIEFFEGRKGSHRLNWKFRGGTRVIDIHDDWKYAQLSAASTFVKRDLLIASGIRFDKTIHLAEDSKFITEVIMESGQYGLMADAAYLYRKRIDSNSAIDSFQSRADSYVPVVENAWLYLLEKYQNGFGVAPRYIQNIVLHDLEWRLTQTSQNALDCNELNRYRESLDHILQRIDIEVILGQRFYSDPLKMYALGMKIGANPLEVARMQDRSYFIDGVEIWKAALSKLVFRVDYLTVTDGNVVFAGQIPALQFPGIEFGISIDGEYEPLQKQAVPQWRKLVNNGFVYFEPFIFEHRFPARPGTKITPMVTIAGEKYEVTMVFEHMARMPRYAGAHRIFGDVMLVNFSNRRLKVERATLFKRIKRELSFTRRIARPLARRGRKGAGLLALRWTAKILRQLNPRDIWMISDRPYAAGDNGEAFFRYVTQNSPKSVEPIFVIRKDSPDYSRMKQIGRVVDPRSLAYLLLMLQANRVISSQADDIVVNPFGASKIFMQDLYRYDFAFLQHGVLGNDLSGWLNRTYRDIRLFVTSSEREQAAVATQEYGYTHGEVVLTGLARFDRLENRPTKTIVFAPSWRLSVAAPVDPKTRKRGYAPDFKESAYFQFIQSVLSDPRLNRKMAEKGFVGELFLHTNHQANACDFTPGPQFSVDSSEHNYAKMFSEAALLVTDYSSVAFDFAYLRKPVIYAQFDQEEFFSAHTLGHGYFSYEDDGFGPVTTDVESTIEAMIDFLESDGQPIERYKTRIEQFFAFADQNNSARIMQELCERPVLQRERVEREK
ncbi:bifunctional glycosyltransferase/CDP-glycerol:glycerophosphate glycerophosphotransferase [Arcanobacterium canis]